MKHGSLFSGIGGFDLAAEWMGWQNIFHCEWMPFPQKVLKHYWPKATSYHDITTTDFTVHRGQIDILTGGFPCQPYSAAGKRLGKEDNRHLWPEMLRAIREIRPRYVVGENVRGLTNWFGGVVFDEVQVDLESAGYEVLPFLLPAVAVNAPHRRDRVWFVAYAETIGRQRWDKQGSGTAQRKLQDAEAIGHSMGSQHSRYSGERDATDATTTRLQRPDKCQKTFGKYTRHCKPNNWQDFPTQPPICGGDDGLPTELDGITFSKWRAESIKGYGNAIVPQVALQIFRAIEQYDALVR